MDQVVKDFLEKEPVCVLAVVGVDGMPHGATVHHSQTTEPVKLFIQTYPTRKVEAVLAQGGSAKAAVVVGFSEEESKTLQMHGVARIVTNPTELEAIDKVHYAKHPSAEQYKGPDTVFLEFTPNWWRYSDLKATPREIIERK